MRLSAALAAAIATITIAAPAAGAAAAPTLWQRHDLLPVTAPVAVGGTVVAFTETRGVLHLTGLNPATGATRWTLPATYSDDTPGQTKTVAHAGNTVYFYSPAGHTRYGGAELTAVDARTGHITWKAHTPQIYLDSVDVCRTSHPVLCLDVLAYGLPMALRVNGTTGAQTLITDAGGRTIGPQLVDTEVRPQETMERVATVSGKVLWRLALSELSPTTPVTTDDGWNWQLVDGVYVGWDATKAPTFNLANQLTFGVRASDGTVLWRRPGYFDCLTPDTTLTAGTLYTCTGSGTVTYPGGHPRARGVQVTLQGLNVHTGATTWTRPVGAVTGALLDTTPATTLGGGKIAVPVDHKPILGIDLHNGHPVTVPHPAAGTAVTWCTQLAFWTPANRSDYTAAPRFGLVRPCTASGHPANATTTMPTDVGAALGHVLVWAQSDGLHAIRR